MSAYLSSSNLVNMLTSGRSLGHHTYEIQRFTRIVCNLLASRLDLIPSWDILVVRINTPMHGNPWSINDLTAVADARRALGEDRCRDLFDSFVSSRVTLQNRDDV
jgi:hypothetical protein